MAHVLRSPVVALLLACVGLKGQTFSPQDKLLILVKGFPASTTMFGYSGKATMFRSVGTNADGSLQFIVIPGADNVDVERNSAKDFTNKVNYGTNGFVPESISCTIIDWTHHWGRLGTV